MGWIKALTFICRKVRFLFWELCFGRFRGSTKMHKCTYLPKPIKPCWSRNTVSHAASTQTHLFLVPSMNFKQEIHTDSVSLFSFLPLFLLFLGSWLHLVLTSFCTANALFPIGGSSRDLVLWFDGVAIWIKRIDIGFVGEEKTLVCPLIHSCQLRKYFAHIRRGTACTAAVFVCFVAQIV